MVGKIRMWESVALFAFAREQDRDTSYEMNLRVHPLEPCSVG